jgi:hypothetical protein
MMRPKEDRHRPIRWCEVCDLMIHSDEVSTPTHAPDGTELNVNVRHENPYVCITRLKIALEAEGYWGS